MEIIYHLFVALVIFLVFADKKVAASKEKMLVFNKPVFSSHVQERLELIKNQILIEQTEDFKENLEKIMYLEENDECKEKEFECTFKDAVTTKKPATTPTGVTDEEAAGDRSAPVLSDSTTAEAETPSSSPSETTTAAGDRSAPVLSDSTTAEAEIPSSFPSETTTGNGCESGWSTYNNSCYLFVQTGKTWEDAKIECSSHNNGAHLVFIESDAENDFVIRLIEHGLNAAGRSSDVWLGLTYDRNDGIWKWDHTAADIPEKGPRAMETGRNPENCARIQATDNFKWNDKECSVSYFFICEILVGKLGLLVIS